MNVRKMLSEITWQEFTEWMAFGELEPFDESRADLRAASICSMLANVNRDKKKRPTPFSVSDFLLYLGDAKKPKQKSWEDMKNIGFLIASSNKKSPAPATPVRKSLPARRRS